MVASTAFATLALGTHKRSRQVRVLSRHGRGLKVSFGRAGRTLQAASRPGEGQFAAEF